jgi:hypothetical protein
MASQLLGARIETICPYGNLTRDFNLSMNKEITGGETKPGVYWSGWSSFLIPKPYHLRLEDPLSCEDHKGSGSSVN